MLSAKLEEEAAKMLDVPGVQNLMLYVADERPPIRCKAASRLIVPTSMVVVGEDCSPAYYSACIALVKNALSSITYPNKKRSRNA